MTQHDREQLARNFKHDIESTCKKYGAFFKAFEEYSPELAFVGYETIRLKLDRKEAIVR